MTISIEAAVANISARRDAEEMMEFIGERPARFWEVLSDLAKAKLPAEPIDESKQPMEYDEAIQFERQEMPYGKHQGAEIGDIPTEYLAWLADGDTIVKQLRRYVQSQTFRQRQDEGN